MKLSVVIAAYNERENVVPLTERLVKTLDGLGADWELLYVVEGTDGTRERLDAAAVGDARIKVLYRAEPSGLGAAFRRGFAAVRPDADLVITMDADLNHQPEEIPGLLAALASSGADIVVGSRFVHGSSVTGIPLWKRALSTSMNAAMRFLWGLRTRDKTSGFRVYRAPALKTLAFRNDNFAFLPEMLIDASRRGYAVVEAPIRFTVRVHGVSKMHILTTSRSYLSLLRSRWDGWSLFALFALAAGVALRAARALPAAASSAAGAAGLLAEVLLLLVFFFLARRLVGRQAACFALLVIALPARGFLEETRAPGPGSAVMLLGLGALWAAAEARERPGTPAFPVLLGVAGGLALRHAPPALLCLLPAALLLRGPRAARALGFAAAGLVFGAAVGIAIPRVAASDAVAAGPSGAASSTVAALVLIFAVDLPRLVATGGGPVGGALVAGYLLAVLAAFRRPPEALRRGRTLARGLAPLGLAGALAAACAALVEAGALPGSATQHLLLVVPLLATCLGLLLGRLALRSLPAALVAGLATVILDLST